MISDRHSPRPRTCIICGAEFMGSGRAKLCGDVCRKRHKAQWQRQYEDKYPRKEYFRQYHIANSAKRNAVSAERNRLYRSDPANKARIREVKRRYWARNALALKVHTSWGVPIGVARKMIERGQFPP